MSQPSAQAPSLERLHQNFLAGLAKVMARRNTPLPPSLTGIPSLNYDPNTSPWSWIEPSEIGSLHLAGQDVNLFKLWGLVMQQGGAQALKANGGWPIVCAGFGLPEEFPRAQANGSTSVAVKLEQIYIAILYPFEGLYKKFMQKRQREIQLAANRMPMEQPGQMSWMPSGGVQPVSSRMQRGSVVIMGRPVPTPMATRNGSHYPNAITHMPQTLHQGPGLSALNPQLPSQSVPLSSILQTAPRPEMGHPAEPNLLDDGIRGVKRKLNTANTDVESGRKATKLFQDRRIPGAKSDSMKQHSSPRWHPDNVQALREAIMAWLTNPQRDQHMLWVLDSGEAGKSAVARANGENAEQAQQMRHLGPTFFFSRKGPGSSTLNPQLSSRGIPLSSGIGWGLEIDDNNRAPGAKSGRKEARKNSILDERPLGLLDQVLRTTHKRKAMLELQNGRAQMIIDFLNAVLSQSESTSFQFSRRHALIALYKLCKSSQLYPQLYVLQDISIESIEDSGGFCDIYKGRHGDQELCLKVVRVFQKQDQDAMLKLFAKEAILLRLVTCGLSEGSVYQIFTRLLPFHEYIAEPPVIGKILAREFPLRVVADPRLDKVDDEMWGMMTRCWTSDHPSRPTYKELIREFELKQFADNTGEAGHDEHFALENARFRNAMRKKSDVLIDSVSIEQVLSEL